jgi:hypothetical protein
MDRSLGRGPVLPALALVLAAAATLLVAFVPAFRSGGLLSPLGLWVVGAAGLGLIAAGAALPSARSGSSAIRRSISVAGVVAAVAVVAVGIGSVVALGDPGGVGFPGPGPTPPQGEPGPVPAEPVPAEGEVLGVVAIELTGGVNVAAKTPNAVCSIGSTGGPPGRYRAVLQDGENVISLDFEADDTGQLGFLHIDLSTVDGQFQFSAGKGWEATPPWVTRDGSPTPQSGSAILTGLVGLTVASGTGFAPAPPQVSGRLTWDCPVA